MNYIGKSFKAKVTSPFVRGKEPKYGQDAMIGETVLVQSFNEENSMYKLDNLDTKPHWFTVTEDELLMLKGIKDEKEDILKLVSESMIIDIQSLIDGSEIIKCIHLENKFLYLQLHVDEQDLKPLYRVYINDNAVITNDNLINDLDEALAEFDNLINTL
jgi:hypothetical protein